MNQPDIGLKVTELRQQKGFTQEKLAEYCEVSARTVQRIENGEVEPRSFTRNSLSNILEFDFGKEGSANESFWLTILHLSSAVCIVLIPLLLWSWKKDQSLKIDRHGREVLNFQITICLILLACVLVLLIVPTFLMILHLPLDGSGTLWGISPLFILLVGLFTTYQGAVNTVRALSDKPIHYPLSIAFVN